MSNITQYTKCSGCGACSQSCPADAIRMDDTGLFYRPVVDEAKCVDCGKCLQVCPVNDPRQGNGVLSAWGAIHQDGTVVKNSSSGGVFTALAETVLASGGVVFGACFREDRKEVILEQGPVEALRKSKYVESRTGDTFRQVKQLLNQGKTALYCGAPCQIAGLKRYLGREYEGLVTCDFACGGMPSHKLYQDYLEGLERQYGAKVETVDFRPKTLGWEHHAIRVSFSNGRVYDNAAELDPYFYVFIYGHYSVGALCLECPFSDSHDADITLADFWKHREFPGWENPGQGLSLVLAATPKGERLLKAAARNMELEQLDIQKASYNRTGRKCTEGQKAKREAFLRDCRESGIRNAARKHGMPSGIRAWKTKMKAFLRYLRWSVK